MHGENQSQVHVVANATLVNVKYKVLYVYGSGTCLVNCNVHIMTIFFSSNKFNILHHYYGLLC